MTIIFLSFWKKVSTSNRVFFLYITFQLLRELLEEESRNDSLLGMVVELVKYVSVIIYV